MNNKFTYISNTCIGAYTYKHLRKKFDNPFMWNIIDYSDFVSLYNNFDNIDFLNFTCEKSSLNSDFYNDTFDIIIDNNVRVHYVHHHNSDEFETIKNIEGDNSDNLYYKFMKGYVIEKYVTRINRMLENNMEPVFILCSHPSKYFNSRFTIENINDFLTNQHNFRYKIYIIRNSENIININDKNIIYVDNCGSANMNGINLAKNYILNE